MHNKKQHIVRKTIIVLGSFVFGIVGTVIAAATYDANIQNRVSSMMKSIRTNASTLAPTDTASYYTLVHLNIQSLLQVLTSVDQNLMVELGTVSEIEDANVLRQIVGNTGASSNNTGASISGATSTATQVTINVAGGTNMLCGDPARNDYTTWSDSNWQSNRTNVIDKSACNAKGNNGVGYVWNVCGGVITNKKTVNSLTAGESFACPSATTTTVTSITTPSCSGTEPTGDLVIKSIDVTQVGGGTPSWTYIANTEGHTDQHLGAKCVWTCKVGKVKSGNTCIADAVTTTATSVPTKNYYWSCAVANTTGTPVAVNTSQHSCNSSNVNLTQTISGSNCTCNSKDIVATTNTNSSTGTTTTVVSATSSCTGTAPTGSGVIKSTNLTSFGGGAPSWDYTANTKGTDTDLGIKCAWTCSPGYTRSGNTCITNTNTSVTATSVTATTIPVTTTSTSTPTCVDLQYEFQCNQAKNANYKQLIYSNGNTENITSISDCTATTFGYMTTSSPTSWNGYVGAGWKACSSAPVTTTTTTQVVTFGTCTSGSVTKYLEGNCIDQLNFDCVNGKYQFAPHAFPTPSMDQLVAKKLFTSTSACQTPATTATTTNTNNFNITASYTNNNTIKVDYNIPASSGYKTCVITAGTEPNMFTISNGSTLSSNGMTNGLGSSEVGFSGSKYYGTEGDLYLNIYCAKVSDAQYTELEKVIPATKLLSVTSTPITTISVSQIPGNTTTAASQTLAPPILTVSGKSSGSQDYLDLLATNSDGTRVNNLNTRAGETASMRFGNTGGAATCTLNGSTVPTSINTSGTYTYSCTNAKATKTVTFSVSVLSATSSCTGTLPTGAGVKSTGYTTVGMVGTIQNSVWRYTEQNYYSCIWECNPGYTRSGNSCIVASAPKTIWANANLTPKSQFTKGESLYGFIEGGDPANTWACLDGPGAGNDCADASKFRKLTVAVAGVADGWQINPNSGRIEFRSGLFLDPVYPNGIYTGYARTGQNGSDTTTQLTLVSNPIPKTVWTNSNFSPKSQFTYGEKLYGYVEGGDPANTWACLDGPGAGNDCSDASKFRRLTVPVDGAADGWQLNSSNGRLEYAGGLDLVSGFPSGVYTGYARTGQYGTDTVTSLTLN